MLQVGTVLTSLASGWLQLFQPPGSASPAASPEDPPPAPPPPPAPVTGRAEALATGAAAAAAAGGSSPAGKAKATLTIVLPSVLCSLLIMGGCQEGNAVLVRLSGPAGLLFSPAGRPCPVGVRRLLMASCVRTP
jgi:hypothetical protein